MKISLIKTRGQKEVITRYSLEEVAYAIQNGWRQRNVTYLREVYHLMNKERQPDGQIQTDWQGGIKLERICFAQELDRYKNERRILGYNGLVVVEVNNLATYEKAVEVRDAAKKMPETLMCFLGASGKSVKIVCRGELFGGGLPQTEEEIKQFHQNLYQTARRAYVNQFGFEIAYLEPRLDRTVYVSADPEMGFSPEARPFYADTKEHTEPQPVNISRESDRLMPGRTIKRTYRLEWQFIIDTVLGHYFELPDEDRLETLLMQIATLCLKQGIPLAYAQGMTMEHPALNTDKLLLKKTFQIVYAVTLQEDYMKKHKIKPLQSIPNDTIQMMKTEIFLNENFEMRKNLMTGVAEYREKYSDDQRFKPVTEEVRNDMTMRATELGLKSWDRDVNRFIDSTRIEQYDPVNTWLDNAEIATLIKENEPYQKLNDLVEMIGETFRKPKPTEQERWWTLPEIHEFLKGRFSNYDPKTSYEKLGRALSNQQFDFESDRKSSGHVYKLMEK